MLFQAGQVWGYVVHGIYSNACYIIRSCRKKKKEKNPTQHLCLYKLLDLTQ